jgi:FkbM family methyltransferase
MARRFAGSRSEFILRLDGPNRSVLVPVRDIRTLMAGLALFGPDNPWDKWRPASDPKRVIDLGANIGLASLYFATRFPEAEVVAVDMMPENASAIRRLAEMNALNIEVAAMAIGAADGTATVQLNESPTRHRLALLESGASEGMGFTDRTITVPISRLGALVGRLGWTSVDLLKVDIEGAEKLLLDDIEGWANLVGTVFLEIHHNVEPRDAESLMKAHSFRVIGGDDAKRTELWFSK